MKNFILVLSAIYPTLYRLIGWEESIIKTIQNSTMLIMALMVILHEGKK